VFYQLIDQLADLFLLLDDKVAIDLIKKYQGKKTSEELTLLCLSLSSNDEYVSMDLQLNFMLNVQLFEFKYLMKKMMKVSDAINK
jgi:hypothetical protein